MISIYTDASISKGRCVSTCFVITDKCFLGYNTFMYDNIDTSVRGELLGAINAIKYVKGLDIDVAESDCVLYSDSINAINLVRQYRDKNMNKQVRIYYDLLEELVILLDTCNVTLKHIKGHQLNHNPNKVVDMISNSMLRYELGKE